MPERAEPPMKGLRQAIGLLTRVPVGIADGATSLGLAAAYLPVVGALIGATIAGVYAVGSSILPNLVAASIAVGSGILLTGALHEDGLADVVDALGAKGREDALRIMDDPVHGTFGALALIITTVIRISALAALSDAGALTVLVGAHALARAAAAWGLRYPAAKAEGVGASFASGTATRSIWRASLIGAIVASAALGVWVVPSLAACFLCSWVIYEAARRRFGGITGDVLGAAEQLSEVVVLVIAAGVVASRWPGLPWWR